MFNSPKLYIITTDQSIVTDSYIKHKYLQYLYPKYDWYLDKETGKRERLSTNKLEVRKDDLIFDRYNWDNGKTLFSLRDKTFFCISEFGDQFKIGESYIDRIDNAFKRIVNVNKDKYDLMDVSAGLDLPIDDKWERNTGDKKIFTGYMDPNIKGVLTGWLRDNNISIKEFLENPRYILFMDDEFHDMLGTLLDNNLVSDSIIEVYEV